jgi:hypothetical protein
MVTPAQIPADLGEVISLLNFDVLCTRVQMALLASRTGNHKINHYWFVGNIGLIHVEFYLAALDYLDGVTFGFEESFNKLLDSWEDVMANALSELAPESVELADPGVGYALLETTQFRDAIRDPGFLSGLRAAGLPITQEEVHLSLLSEGSAPEEYADEVTKLRQLWRRQ